MKEIMEFVFSSFWIFCGTVLIITSFAYVIENILEGLNNIIRSILGR